MIQEYIILGFWLYSFFWPSYHLIISDKDTVRLELTRVNLLEFGYYFVFISIFHPGLALSAIRQKKFSRL